MRNAKSIRAKLYNLAKQEQIDFQTIVTRYLHESVLSRISRSQWKNHFFLKGGILMYAMQGLHSRPTTDIDFLGQSVPNNTDSLLHIFSEILQVKTDDAVIIDSHSMQAKIINELNTYNGIRINVKANFDTINQSLQIDIGFWDIIIPDPIQIEYPILLQETASLILWAYTPETVIAEKLQAIVVLAQLNSRMKDFYDIFILITSQNINNEVLKEAINQTFKQRNTDVDFDSIVFTEPFYRDAERLKMWSAFIKKINVSFINFETVIITIKNKLKEINF